MSTYTAIPTLATKQVLTYLHMNILKTNIDIIRSPGRYYYLKPSGEADLTVAGAAFVDIAAPFSTTIDVSGNPVRCILYVGRHTTGGGATQFDLLVDGVSVRGAVAIWSGGSIPINITWIVDGLTAGNHTFKFQWLRTVSGTATIFSANGVMMEVREE